MTLKLTEMVSLAVGCYCGVFCLALAGFFLYTVDLASRDITSNESIRKKWNGQPRLDRHKVMPPFFARVWYIVCVASKTPSRVEQYLDL